MDLITTLNNLGKSVKKQHRDVNRGGCCVFASMVALELEKRGYKVQGIAASHWAKNWDGKVISITWARKKIEDNHPNHWSDHDVSFGHVGLEFKYKGRLYHYDTAGVNAKQDTLDKMPIYRGRLSIDEMVELAALDDGSWNPCFVRSEIPHIQRLVSWHFKRLDRSLARK